MAPWLSIFYSNLKSRRDGLRSSLWEFSQIMAAKNEKSVSLTDSDVKTFLGGKENQYTKKKPKCKY